MEQTVVVASQVEQVGPKVKIVGTVDLSQFEKKKKEVNFELHGTYPLELHAKAVGLAIEANKKLGIPNVITLSKVAKIKVKKPDGKFTYEEQPGKGSIWFGCSPADLKKYFLAPLRILEVCAANKIRKITKSDFMHLAYGKEFFFMYVKENGRVEVIKNKKVNNGEANEKLGVWYSAVSDSKNTPYCMNFNDIKIDSTFDTGVKGETGYICVLAGTENI